MSISLLMRLLTGFEITKKEENLSPHAPSHIIPCPLVKLHLTLTSYQPLSWSRALHLLNITKVWF